MVTRNTLAAALASTSLVLPAQAQNFCQTSGDKISLGFEVKPSLVAHSDAIMETTFDDVSLPGGDEGLFSFKRTIGAILESAGATNDQASRVAFVQTMLDSFPTADGFALNPAAGVLMPLDAREERSDLIATDLLDESSDQAMEPLAVFNRFDLAPSDFVHCGEYRIVYGKANPNNPTPNRFLLIFEASVPNPDPSAGEEGCRPITEFWAGLSGVGDDTEVARRLSAFFYEGKMDTVTLDDPVVDYKNYGGDGPRGQVRGNLFTQFPWQLREWLTQETFDTTNPLAFVRDTVKDNPLAELYQDDISGPPLGPPRNIASALTALHGDFVASLTSVIRNNLMSEETEKHRTLKNHLDRYDLGSGPTKEVDESKILLNTIALGNDFRFNEHQSTSQVGIPPEDVIASKVGPVMRSLLEQVGATPSPFPAVNPQTAEVILARAQAGTCAGCHQLSPGTTVREIPNQADVVWPEVVKDTTSSPFPNSEGFVHVREDRVLSPALEESFLPFRRYVLGHHLCPPPEAPAPVVAAVGGLTEADAALAALEEAPAPRSPGVMRFVDAIVADFAAAPTEAAGAPAAATAEQPARAAEAIAQLDPVAREVLRQTVHRAIAQVRREEQSMPGAFVEVWRPH
jgi:hypothetical protein